MPNGGSDNCGECLFNSGTRFDEPSYCRLRKVPISIPFWTYCDNFGRDEETPVGPIYADALYEQGYARIPWDGSAEPRKVDSGTCHICQAGFSSGLAITDQSGNTLDFCCNAHYMKWWRRRHRGEKLSYTVKFKDPGGLSREVDEFDMLRRFGNVLSHRADGIPEGSFSFPLDDIIHCLRSRKLQESHAGENPRAKYASQMDSEKHDYVWFYFQSPPDTWKNLCGRAGWMVIAKSELRQIAFFVEVMN